MTNRHYAKLADVWKHLVLCEVLELARPEQYAESHAGSAWYPLTESAQRAYGVFRFLAQAERSRALMASSYRRVLAQSGGAGIPERYPGSAVQAMTILGARASFLLCDLDPESASSLREAAEELHVGGQTEVVKADGPTTIWERVSSAREPDGWAIHVDPFEPHEAASDNAPNAVDLARLAGAAGATVVYWFGYEEGESPFWAFEEITASANARTWTGSIRYPEEDSDSPITGCGVVVLPSEVRTEGRLDALGRGLEEIYADAPLPSGGVGSITFESRVRRG